MTVKSMFGSLPLNVLFFFWLLAPIVLEYLTGTSKYFDSEVEVLPMSRKEFTNYSNSVYMTWIGIGVLCLWCFHHLTTVHEAEMKELNARHDIIAEGYREQIWKQDKEIRKLEIELGWTEEDEDLKGSADDDD